LQLGQGELLGISTRFGGSIDQSKFSANSEAENEVYLEEASKLIQIGEDLSLAQEKPLRLQVALIEIFEDQQYQLNPATSLEILKDVPYWNFWYVVGAGKNFQESLLGLINQFKFNCFNLLDKWIEISISIIKIFLFNLL
jgi:hypothetical protein